MNPTRILLWTFGLVVATSMAVYAQNAGDYRSAATGDWNALSTWQTFSGTQWESATTVPDSGAGAVEIQSGHTVTVTADVIVDSVRVLGGGSLNVNSGTTVTVAFNNDGRGIDVDTLGVLSVGGTILCEGRVEGEPDRITFGDGSVYDHARNAGSVPRSTWETGSTFKLSGITANNPSNTNQDFHHLVIDCPSMTANLNMRMTGNTIHGNITVYTTGSQRYYLTAPDAYVDPITILGDIYVYDGVFSSNGSGNAASIVVYSYGNINVTGGNFGCSRGSGPSVSWYLYGDSMRVENATLQNSTSSPLKIQKFIFAKQGTQYLNWSNVAYGSATSPITLQVSSGTTLDIGTTHITNSNSGSFLLDSAATLVSIHNGPGFPEGSIECLGDLGGYNTFVNIKDANGAGYSYVTAYTGTHPNSYDAEKTLRRWWTISADVGITAATLTLYYHDYGLTPEESDVRGDETQYKALRYLGSATSWFTEAGSTVDVDFDFVTATGVTTITGEWTAGETAPTSVAEEVTEVPSVFYVDQNFPNPFNPTTTIVYGLPKDDWVNVKVYNLIGQEVATLFEGQNTAGVHRVAFDAGSYPSGVYVYRVQAGSADIVKRMMLVK